MRAFFTHVYPFCDTLLSLEGDAIAAMATLIPCEIVALDQPPAPALYLYSLTTHPSFRGRGHAKAILAKAQKKCSRVFLHAADDSLFSMYQRLGWQPAMHACYTEMPPARAQTVFTEIGGEEYYRIRETALKNAPHIRWNQHTCNFLHDMLSAYGGGLYMAQEAVITVQEEKDGILYLGEAFGKEAPGLAAGIALRYGCDKCHLLIPCAPDTPGAFPMAQSAGADIPAILQVSFVFL